MSAKSGSLSIVHLQLGLRKVSVIQSSRVSTIQGLLKYSSEWPMEGQLGLGELSVSGVSVKRGSTVPMYEIIAMCIELATVSRANSTCEYKAGEGVPCYSRSIN